MKICRDERLSIGTRVILRTTDPADDDPDMECGIVLQTWWDTEVGTWDAYIAFYGDKFPDPDTVNEPDKPYVLRYFCGGLEILDDEQEGK